MSKKSVIFLSIVILLLALLTLIASFIFSPNSESHQIEPYLIKQNKIVIINAGSSGTRAHVLSINNDKTVSKLQEPVRRTPGISSFVDNEQELAKYMRDIVDNIHTTEKLPVYLMATAGMRFVEQNDYKKAQKIYQIINQELIRKFDIKYVGTITGRAEALYDWITVDYLKNKLSNFNNSYLALDMGGASTQIAYVDEQNSSTEYNYNLVLNNFKINLFIYSFLGLGYNKAVEHLEKFPDCTTKFEISNCTERTKQLIDNFNVRGIAGDLSKYNIVAFDNIHKLLVYFNIADSKTPIKDLNLRIKSQCTLSENSNNKINRDCIGGIYISNLLSYGYSLNPDISSSQLEIIKTIDHTTLDWSLGAGIYHGITGKSYIDI